MAQGRPTTYSEEMLSKTNEYLLSCEDVEMEREGTRGFEYKLNVKLPTIEGLSVYLGVSRDSLYEWATKHKDFSDTLDSLRAEQADKLINNGLSGSYNSTIAKLMLSSNHGMREKSDVTTNDKDLPSPIMNLNEILRNNSTTQDSDTE